MLPRVPDPHDRRYAHLKGLGGLAVAAVRERCATAANDNICSIIDLFLATMYARIATGEVSGTLADALRNPGFALRHARGAAKRGRAMLEHLAATIDDRGFGGERPSVELELAKLAVHERRTDDARVHLRCVQELLAHEPDAAFAYDATALLATL